MKNRYDIILVAGSRVSGLPKFSSAAEQGHHELHVRELQQELGKNLLVYHSSLGFITAILDENEYHKYSNDHRIYSITLSPIIESRSARLSQRDTSEHDQWHLKQLSNRLAAQTNLLCGFKLELKYTRYGVYINEQTASYIDIAQEISISSSINKILHKFKLYNFEIDQVNSVVVTAAGQDVDAAINYIGYNTVLDTIELRTTVIDTFIPIYTVGLITYTDPITLYWSGSPNGVVGFKNLVLVPEAADIYQSTVQG